MKILYLIDPVSNAIDNSFQREVVTRLAKATSTYAETFVLDTAQIGRKSAAEVMIQQEFDIYFTYNRTGTDMAAPGEKGVEANLMSSIQRPHVCWLTEHPLCWYENYFTSQNNRHYILPRASHAPFLSEMGLAGSVSEQLFAADPYYLLKLHKDRKFDVCIAAQWRGPAIANEFWTQADEGARLFFESVLACQAEDPNKDTYTAYVSVANLMGINISDRLKHAKYMRSLYWHARKSERIAIVQDIVSSGLEIAIIGGDKWRSVLPPSATVTYLPECGHTDILDIYADSRAVVNLNAANGACERAFDCASVGAMLITEYSPAMEQMFATNDAAIFYHTGYKKNSLQLITDLIKSGHSEVVGTNALGCLNQRHTWSHRTDFLSKKIFEKLIIKN
jgi:hypothetical protein